MATLPLDLDGVIGELRRRFRLQPQAPAGTRIGHVHLQVADLADAEAFYHGVLGFDVIVPRLPRRPVRVRRRLPPPHRAQHMAQRRAPRHRHPGSVGLRSFELELPHARARDDVLARVRAAGIPMSETESGPLIADPFASGVLLTAR